VSLAGGKVSILWFWIILTHDRLTIVRARSGARSSRAVATAPSGCHSGSREAVVRWAVAAFMEKSEGEVWSNEADPFTFIAQAEGYAVNLNISNRIWSDILHDFW
jgi:hypothetical protein